MIENENEKQNQTKKKKNFWNFAHLELAPSVFIYLLIFPFSISFVIFKDYFDVCAKKRGDETFSLKGVRNDLMGRF
jgi:hypothetical protein